MKRNKKRFAAILAAMIVAASATTTAFAATANLSSVLELAIRASATALTISEVAPQSTPAATPSAPAASAAPSTPAATPSTGTATSGYIGEAKAKQIAMNHAGVSNPNFVQAKLDYEDGVVVYDVEFYSGNKEYDYEINATTGAIVSYDYDIENYAIPGGTTTTTAPSASGTISAEKAKQIALSHAGVSASNAYAMKVGMDYEHGVQIYEIDFKSGYMEYEYDINAQTGAILKAESDYDD